MDLNMTDLQIAWPAELDLGEGPLWHAASQSFYFVDIHGCAIHAWTPATEQRQSWRTPERIGWLIPRTDGDGFIAGLQSGFARLWLEPELRIEPFGCPHPKYPDVRLNDAKADRWGRIWAGSMNNVDPGLKQGQLTRLDTNGQFTVVESDIYIANGPAIAQDGSWMLHNDSYRDTTYRYRMTEDGQLTDKTVWRKFTAAQGTPDGMTMDADGNVWIAFWGGACIRQFTPAAEFIRQIDLPAPNITSMAFGGDSMDMMLITSARNGLTAEQLAQYPQAGSAFVLRCGVKGNPPFGFGPVQAA
jgi:D-xylonolactonase